MRFSRQEYWSGLPFPFPKHIPYHTENRIANGNLLYDAGSSNPVLCDNLEGWYGVGGGREVQEGGDISMRMTDSCCCTAETNTIL